MPTNLLEGFVSITVKEDEVRGKLAKTESGFKQAVKRIDQETEKAGKSFDALAGKAGGVGEALEHGIIHGFGHVGRMLAGGGLVGLLAMEGVRMGMEFVESANGAEKNSEALKELADSMRTFRMETQKASVENEKFIRQSHEAAQSGHLTRRTGAELVKQFDERSKKLSDSLDESGKKVDAFTDAQKITDAKATPEGQRVWKAAFEVGMARTARGEINPTTGVQWEQGAAKELANQVLLGRAKDILTNAPSIGSDIRDLDEGRAELMKRFGFDPNKVGLEANPFLNESRGGGGFKGLEDYSKGIQDGLLNNDKGATEDTQVKILDALQNIKPLQPGASGAVWS